MTTCLFLLAALVDFADAGHGWVRTSPHLREMRQVADGALIRTEGADPHLTSPTYTHPAPSVPGSRVVYELRTSPSDIRSYTLYYSFGDATPDELTKLDLLPVERQPPFSCYRGELPSPDVLPGRMRYRLDPPGGQRNSVVLRSFDWRFREPLWDGGFDVALPHDFSSSVSLVGEGWTLRQDPHHFLAWAIDVGGERVVESPDSEPVLYRDAGGMVRAIDWKTAQVKVRKLDERLQVTAQVRDAENVPWRFERTFVARTANVLEVLSRVSTEKPVRIVHLPYLTALVDRGSRGRKAQAVLPGVEYLEDEPSSNEKELLGRHARRGVVEAWKITSPLMLLVRSHGEGASAVSLGWERPDPLGPQVASAVFDTPDRRFRSGGHLMGLWAPAVGAGRESGEWGVYEAPSFSDGEVRATITLGDEKTGGAALARLVRTLPPVVLPSDQEIAGRLAGAWTEGRLGTGGVWRTECGRKGREMVAVDACGALEWLAVAQPSLAPTLDGLQRQTLAKAATTDGNARFGWGEQMFRWSCPDAPFVWGDAYRRQLDQDGHLARMVAAWRRGYSEYQPPPQGHDFSRGLETKDVNGLSSYNTLWLMRTAVWSGNETLISEALAVADRTRERYAGTVPRGAQSWEMPLHCPDLLASANLSEAFALAYLLSADVKFLDAARYWASTGLAFVSTDGLPYATTGVFGASEWRLTDWIGRPVQWCGLVYAHALLQLAEVETMASRRAFWHQLASGICACAVRQCWPADDPSYGGLLPDSVDPVSGARYLGALNTRGLIEVAAGLGPSPLYAVIRPVADRPYLVQAPTRMCAETPCGDEFVRLSLTGWMRRPFQLLVTRIDGPVSVLLDGRPVPCRFRNRTATVELPAGASGRLTVRPVACDAGSDPLVDAFRSPPPSARPETWWHWMNGNVTREGIVADLDAMAAIGIGGVHIFDAGCAVPPGPLEFNTPAWFETVRFAVSEAAKRGMSVTLANCSGYSAAGGPWIAPSNAMKTVCYTETDVKGPASFDGKIPCPENRFGFYEDIAVLAYPLPNAELAAMESAGGRVAITASGTTTVCTVEFPAPFEASEASFRMGVAGWDVPAHMVLEAEGQNGWKRLVDEETYAVAQGQVDENRRAFQFAATTASRWRLVFSFPQVASSVSLSDIRLSRGLRIPNIANRALYLRSYERMKSYEPLPDQVVPQASVVDLSASMGGDGSLRWSVPEGAWRILRIGHAANGKCCHPASAGGKGYESDKLSKRATDIHFDSYIGRMYDILGPRLAGAVHAGFKSVLVDSWEAGSQNWTQGFEREFLRRKGYDLRKFLPVLAGTVVGGKDETERFLSDYRDVISRLFKENFADELARKCHERGLKLTLEPYGTFPSTPELYVQAADTPMCEFWVPPAYGLDDRTVRLVSDLVHRSRPGAVIAAESFTGKPDESRWQQDPFSLKAVGDKMYAIGVNRIVYHRYAHQPWTDRRYSPGMTMGRWGMHFERTETWWYEAKDWISYQTRCQALLQAGVYVDSCRDPDLRWLERRYEDGTVGFFVACANPDVKKVRLELPQVGRSVELWDAETGEISLADDWYVEDGRTRLSVELKPSGSVFVMMRPQATRGASTRRAFACARERTVSGPWNVSFSATYPPPQPILLEHLMSLSEHPSDDIRHFSGSSVYRKTVTCERGKDERIVLDLGCVKNLAEVSVNGIKFPVLWRPPFRVDVTDAVKEGVSTNDVCVRVVNLWVNRLIGDEELPPDVEWRGEALSAIPDWVKRGAASPTGRHSFTTWHHWRKGDPLPEFGLMGPVRLLIGN